MQFISWFMEELNIVKEFESQWIFELAYLQKIQLIGCKNFELQTLCSVLT